MLVGILFGQVIKKIQETQKTQETQETQEIQETQETQEKDVVEHFGTDISGWDIFWTIVNWFGACWAVYKSWTCYKFQDYSTWFRVFLAIIAFSTSWIYIFFDYLYCSVPTIEKATQALRKAERRADKASEKHERKLAKIQRNQREGEGDGDGDGDGDGPR
jgi:hypothetical protein